MFCRSLFVLLHFFLLAIVLSVLIRFTDSDYLPLVSLNSSYCRPSISITFFLLYHSPHTWFYQRCSIPKQNNQGRFITEYHKTTNVDELQNYVILEIVWCCAPIAGISAISLCQMKKLSLLKKIDIQSNIILFTLYVLICE